MGCYPFLSDTFYTDRLVIDFSDAKEGSHSFFKYPSPFTQRGNRREDVFFTDEDREKYLEQLKEALINCHYEE